MSCSNLTTEVSLTVSTNDCLALAGTLPYNFSISSGTFPPGLTLNASTGAITGVPTTAGSYNFTQKVVDSGSPAQTVTQTINILVQAYQPLACGAAQPPSSAKYDAYFTAIFCPAFGGTAPYIYSLTGNVPPGLAIYQGFGIVEGTPTQAGTYSFNVVVEDSASPTATITYPVNNFVVGAYGTETGTVTITATSGGITNTTTINVTVP
jgi:hypothetical protein